MKKAVAFLLAFLIFVAPMTTLVKADVVIGDNDNIIINENATILGRKLALMESLSDLALSGVTEFSISNTSDLDSYFDSLWSEINDAIDYLDSGEWADDLQSNIASRYFTNLVQYKDYINNRGDYLSHLLPSGNPTSNLLSTFFANNIFGKHSTLHNNLSLDALNALSNIRNGNSSGNPDPNYTQYIEIINGQGFDNWFNHCHPRTFDNGTTTPNNWIQDNYSYWFFGASYMDNTSYTTAKLEWNNLCCTSIYDVYIYSNNGVYSYSINPSNLAYIFSYPLYNPVYYNNGQGYSYNGYWYYYCSNRGNIGNPSWNQSFNSLENLFKHLSACCHNVNIYVDGVPWSIVGVPHNPTLDIDGYLKIYGNDNPIQYELQPGTKIDYDELYTTIYNAIRDNLPISQGDINYYDSHDTIYSPTIINNYGEEEGDESDLIDTILDYAVIPKFDTAIAQPMRSALTNGVVIMQNSITNVIPNEILLILGACFFLLLFAVVINRMIK